MGKPVAPNRQQYAQLEQSSQLAQIEPDQNFEAIGGSVKVNFDLPRQGVSLIQILWPETQATSQ